MPLLLIHFNIYICKKYTPLKDTASASTELSFANIFVQCWDLGLSDPVNVVVEGKEAKSVFNALQNAHEGAKGNK